MSGIICGCHNQRTGASGIQWLETRDVAEHPAMHSTASYGREVSGFKCPEVQKILPFKKGKKTLGSDGIAWKCKDYTNIY